ncbi:ABC transporter substrate-binding protein [Ramlibacter alkalitolerans]|jgi:ABC-type branched-subunit amino acid transport system substrate-binding protein|uniref:ABC transporter substrate-binding protein n=1 Tax=Ramlibacter alkalitolerans TaxID=2039631 RepID=A0ABS1JWV3_9BURK|nr:ABC transporter substrate-binding protein [Ramlibacter alkalitolerans]MBL0428616.1 ABC transporter substrate-binding protein [Ramlibacter alkalitolerans]
MRILACALLLAAAPALAQEIIVGQSAPLTGGNAELGNDIRNGALAYFHKVNEAGGIAGAKIKLVTLDDHNETKLSAENAKKLVEENNAVALFGFASSTLSIPAMPQVVEHKVPFFAPFTGADTIRKQNEYVYTVRATYADEIGKIINFWGNLGNTKVTVLHYDDTVGKQNFETVAEVLKKFNRTPVSVAIKRNAEVTEANVRAVVASDPNVLVVTTLYAPAAQMLKKLKAQGRVYMTTSLSFAGASQLAKALGPDASGVSVAITVPTPRSHAVAVVRECNEAWTGSGQKELMSVTALESCIAAKVLTEGMRRAGSNVTRASLHKALSALGRFDTGGYVVDFKPNFRHGGSYVGMALLKPNGEVRE